MSTKTIVVHGATGSQGRPVAQRLAHAGHQVREASRATGADLLDRAALQRAYAGADVVILQLPLVYDDRALAMGANAAEAAAAAGIEQLVVNAGGPLPPEPIGVPFVDARHVAAAADVPLVTVLQPTTYLENLTSPYLRERLVGEGVIAYPLAPAFVHGWTATADVADAALGAIERGVAGSFELPSLVASGEELAEQLGRALDRALRYEAISPDAFAELLRPHLGDHAADETAAVYRMLADAPAPPLPDGSAAREALGWEPRSLEAWAREADLAGRVHA